jgi:hypothetical protein
MKIGILAPRHLELNKSFGKSTSMLYPAVGNFGNLLFRSAVQEHVRDFDWINWGGSPKEASEKFDLIVLPLANLLTPWADEDLKAWASTTAKFLKDAQLPIMALGMGAQADIGDDSRLSICPEIIGLARVISEHSLSIGVRGEFSADVLKAIGVKNTTVIGCPSNFLSESNSLGMQIQKRQNEGAPDRIVFTGKDFDFQSTTLHRSVQRRLFDYAELHDGFYIVQAEEAAVRLTRRDSGIPESIPYRDKLRNYLRPWDSEDVFSKRLSKRFISLPHVAGWLEFLSSVDLSVGMRIHGSIAATQAGTPNLTIIHDMRTYELCETIGLPFVTMEKFVSDSYLGDTVGWCGFNGKLYDAKRVSLAQEYKGIFSANGLKCHLPFKFRKAKPKSQ